MLKKTSKLFLFLLIILLLNFNCITNKELKKEESKFRSFVEYNKINKKIKLIELYNDFNELFYLNLEIKDNDLYMKAYFGKWNIENNIITFRIDVYKESINNKFVFEFDSRKNNDESIIFTFNIVNLDYKSLILNNKIVKNPELYKEIIDQINNNFIEDNLKYDKFENFNLVEEGPQKLIKRLL